MIRRRSRRSRSHVVEEVENRCLLSAIVVTTLADNVDPGDGETTLREAIGQANQDSDADAITFAPGLTGTLTLLLGPISIDNPVEITGRSTDDTIIDAGGESSIFTVNMYPLPSDVRFKSMTLRNAETALGLAWHEDGRGSVELDDLTFIDNTQSALRSRLSGDQAPQHQPKLRIRNTRFLNNTGNSGGAMHLQNGVEATIESTRFEGNSAVYGGAIYTDNTALADSLANGEPLLTITNSLLANNSAQRGGGAILASGDLQVVSSTIRDNFTTLDSGDGGGIWFRDFRDRFARGLHIVASSVINNTASRDGGGIYTTTPFSDYFGANIVNSTVAGNVARDGGGLYMQFDRDVLGPAYSVVNSTIVNNTASREGGGAYVGQSDWMTINIASTILASNTAVTSPDLKLAANRTTFSHNLLGDNSGTDFASTGSVPDADGNLIGSSQSALDPQLGPLTEFGTISAFEPSESSPVLDRGSNPQNLDGDNRGRSRVRGPAPDIGSIELTESSDGPSAELVSGLLTVLGTAEADSIDVRLTGSTVMVKVNSASWSFANASIDAINVFGFAGNDHIIAAFVDQPMLITGDDGADTIKGGLGTDTIRGGHGNDSLRGTQGDDLILGELGNDTLLGQRGNDTVFGGAGNDRLFGNEDNDVLDAGDGANTLNGGSGNDELTAGDGHDLLIGGGGNDFLQAGDGNNRLRGGGGHDTMHAGSGDDRFGCGSGADLVSAGLGDNYVNGGNGHASWPLW